MFAFCACNEKHKTTSKNQELIIEVIRYDRLQSRYLTTGDFSALQQMSTGFPMETRILIEDVLDIGQVNDVNINSKFLNFFQDTIAQSIISEAEAQYAKMEDINRDLSHAFQSLRNLFPNISIPKFYAQISALRQSIIVSDNTIGISIDKYLGEDYQLYKRYYKKEQRQQMNRWNIVPDCLSFYLISLFPLKNFEICDQQTRDLHIAKIHWVTNKVLAKQFYKDKDIYRVEKLMHDNHELSIEDMLRDSTILQP